MITAAFCLKVPLEASPLEGALRLLRENNILEVGADHGVNCCYIEVVFDA